MLGIFIEYPITSFFTCSYAFLRCGLSASYVFYCCCLLRLPPFFAPLRCCMQPIAHPSLNFTTFLVGLLPRRRRRSITHTQVGVESERMRGTDLVPGSARAQLIDDDVVIVAFIIGGVDSKINVADRFVELRPLYFENISGHFTTFVSSCKLEHSSKQ